MWFVFRFFIISANTIRMEGTWNVNRNKTNQILYITNGKKSISWIQFVAITISDEKSSFRGVYIMFILKEATKNESNIELNDNELGALRKLIWKIWNQSKMLSISFYIYTFLLAGRIDGANLNNVQTVNSTDRSQMLNKYIITNKIPNTLPKKHYYLTFLSVFLLILQQNWLQRVFFCFCFSILRMSITIRSLLSTCFVLFLLLWLVFSSKLRVHKCAFALNCDRC